jgi:hypothetical protein
MSNMDNRVNAGPGLTVKEKIQYSLLGLLLVGGGVFIGRKIIKKAAARREQDKTFEEGSPATIAKQIKMAFENDGWWGTDKAALRVALRSIRTRPDFDKVLVSYKRLYNESLLADMQSELKATEYNEMLSIVAAKPEKGIAQSSGAVTEAEVEGWAKRLKAAFDIYYGIFPGTDEGAIRAVFIEIPTQAVFNEVSGTYQTLFGSSLSDDLSSELEFWEIEPMLQIIKGKPKN